MKAEKLPFTGSYTCNCNTSHFSYFKRQKSGVKKSHWPSSVVSL